MEASSVCNMPGPRPRKTSFDLEGDLVSAFLLVFRGRNMSSSWNIQMWTQRKWEDRQKSKNRFNKAKQQLRTCSARFLGTFRRRNSTTTTWKCLISRFVEEVNKRRRNFLSLSNLNKVLRNSTLRGEFVYNWLMMWVGIIAMKIF